MRCSIYYQAIVKKESCWHLTAILRSYEHLAFDRTINIPESRFEFFVAPEMEHFFLQLMEYFVQKGIVTELQKLPNRLCCDESV